MFDPMTRRVVPERRAVAGEPADEPLVRRLEAVDRDDPVREREPDEDRDEASSAQQRTRRQEVDRCGLPVGQPVGEALCRSVRARARAQGRRPTRIRRSGGRWCPGVGLRLHEGRVHQPSMFPAAGRGKPDVRQRDATPPRPRPRNSSSSRSSRSSAWHYPTPLADRRRASRRRRRSAPRSGTTAGSDGRSRAA